MKQILQYNSTTDINAKRCFEDICREWLEQKEIKLKKSSFNKYCSLAEQYLFPILGEVTTDNFQCNIFENGLYQIMNYNRTIPFSKSTMNTFVYIIRAVLKFGERHGYNQALQIEFECHDTISKINCPILDVKEEQILINYLQKEPKNSNYLGIILSLMTGMRLGEICALKRESINEELRIINICKTVQRVKMYEHTKLVVSSPKSQHSIRTIPLPEIIFDYMSTIGIWELSSEQYILSKREYPYEPRTLQYAFKCVLDKCNINHKNFHVLRHTFATNCVELGFDIKTLSELLGHSNVSFTLNRYVHSSILMKQRQMQLLNNKYKKIIDE